MAVAPRRRWLILVALAIAVAIAAVLMVAASEARADETIFASGGNKYIPDTYTIDQGEKVSFRNLDNANHTVTAEGKGSDGKPLFDSGDPIGPGTEVPVVGTEFLTTGSYPFFCTVHPFQKGTLNVNSSGYPAPRPTPDTTAPTIRVRILDTKLARVRKRGKLRVKLTSDEPGTRFALTARARLGGKSVRLASGKASIASTPGSRNVSLTLTRAGKKALRKVRRARVTLSARGTDGAGNSATTRASRTLA